MGALHVDWHELGRYPFRIRKDEFSPERRDEALGGVGPERWKSGGFVDHGNGGAEARARADSRRRLDIEWGALGVRTWAFN